MYPTSLSLKSFTCIGALLGMSVIGACDDAPTDGPDTTDTQRCEMAPMVVALPAPEGGEEDSSLSLAGRIVDSDGNPVEGAFVQACCAAICLASNTGADGSYSFAEGVRTDMYKIGVGGFKTGHMSFNYYQDPVTQPNLAVAVTAYDKPSTAAPLPKETGGTVTLADGELVLTAPAGIKYDIGEPAELTAVKVPQAELPPYDFDLTTCSSDPVVAYIINPLKTKLEEGSFEVTAKIGASPGAKYGIWVVDANAALVHKEATATADANGDVIKDAGSTLRHLDTIIFVPE